MTFDPVHDSQAVHRALIRAFSFPGTLVDLAGPSSRFDDPGLPAALGAVALTLLDQETSYFHPDSGVLTELTGARRRPAAQAAFLFLSKWDEAAWVNAFEQGSRGTLPDPHTGATLVAFAPTVNLKAWTASGPGIEHPRTVELPGGAWVEARRRACAEFPLGMDLIWVQDGGVLALPRTTRLAPEGGL